MKLEIASTALRREHAAATRRLVNILVERLTALAPSGNRPARLGQVTRNRGFNRTQRCTS